MLETLRERLLSVQQDFTSGLKTLSDKSREVKVKSKPRTVPYLPKYSAGLELLSRYEDTWAALHRRAKECASAGELVDSEVVMLSAHWEKKTTSLIELQEQLQQLPGLIADLESMTANLAHLEASFEEVENRLLHLEDLCEQCELERCRHVQSQHLENYKKSKRKELEAFKADLDAEHSKKVLEMEHAQQMKLKERQKFFEEAFQQDMEQYLSTGYLQISERRGPGSETCQNELTLQVPDPTELPPKPPSSPSACTGAAAQDAEGEDGPLVQADEEEVQADTALATFHTDGEAKAGVSGDSDSSQDV
ncbi:dysbindin isoform X2 [Heterocephalus glaber]|uniref:Dysbindin isoform X2 n=1 Tax=Heterocephalus glaber TaxID=10181 RepID=A0AAX6PBN8_HETGA|nr:dysbindin isoform X2 [Heterocephalus glaber]